MSIKDGGQGRNGARVNGLTKKATNSFKSGQMCRKDGDGRLIGKFNLHKIVIQKDFNMRMAYQTYIIQRLGRKI